MNLTKILCKYFDEEEKGYVTIGDILKGLLSYIGDILKGLLSYSAVCVAIGLYLFGVYTWLVTGINTMDTETSFIDFLIGVLGVSAAITTCVVGVVVGTYCAILAYDRIESIKVVSCKKDDGKEE